MHGLKTELQIKNEILVPDEKVRAMILQIVRELLFNFVKHAGTDRAVVRAKDSAEDHIIIEVVDEGSGFDADKLNFGVKTEEDLACSAFASD